MDFSIFADPYQPELEGAPAPGMNTLGANVIPVTTLSDIQDNKIPLAIVGVVDDRLAVNNAGVEFAANAIREQLFQLFPDETDPLIADVGNIKKGETPEETYEKLDAVLSCLHKHNVVTIIIGGGNEVGFYQYHSFFELETLVNVALIDSTLNFGSFNEKLNSNSFAEKIVLAQNNYLYQLALLGNQVYNNDPKVLGMVEKMGFDTVRLAQLRGNVDISEPYIRNADIVSFDMSAIRSSDAPANKNASPNGLYAEEACKILKFAGHSEKVCTISICEYNPMLDFHHQTGRLVAQMIWSFIEGFFKRKNDFPIGGTKDYQKFLVETSKLEYPLVFFKSHKTGRWWFENPLKNHRAPYRHSLIPCSYKDYVLATKDELPDSWWKVLSKQKSS